jgi:hypothetical protein
MNMHELINICIICKSARQQLDILDSINILLRASPVWIGKPESGMFLDLASGHERNMTWPIPDCDMPINLGDTLFFVYLKADGAVHNSITISQSSNRVVYTVSTPLIEMVKHPILIVESWIADLFIAMSSYGSEMLAAGSEMTIDPLESEPEIIKYLVSDFLNSFWIIVDSRFLLEPGPDLVKVKEIDGSSLFRRKSVARYLYGIGDRQT